MIALSAAALLAFAGSLVFLFGDMAPDAGSGAPWTDHVTTFVVALVAVSLLHVGACVLTYRMPPRLEVVLLVALAARLVLLFGAGTPTFESDQTRERFEAAQVRAGLNPYEFVVADLELTRGVSVPRALVGEKADRFVRSQSLLSEGDYGEYPQPELRSTQSPLAQWIGALADHYKSDSRRGYAFLALLADAAAIFFLVLTLVELGRAPGLVMLYAWSPVLLHEVYSSLAVDVFVLPGLAGLVWCVAKGRRSVAAFPFAVAAAIRPAMFLLVSLTWHRLRPVGFLLLAILTIAPVVPFWATDAEPAHYIQGTLEVWNEDAGSSLFRGAAEEGFSHIPGPVGRDITLAGVQIARADDSWGPLLAKAASLLLLLGILVVAAIRCRPRRGSLARVRCSACYGGLLAAVAGLIVVAPRLEPRHTIWLLPILVVRPALSWMALPGFACVGYLQRLTGPAGTPLLVFESPIPFPYLIAGGFLLLWMLDIMWRERLFGSISPTREDGWTVDATEFADGEESAEFDSPSPRMVRPRPADIERF